MRRSDCPICFALDIVGDRWTLLVLRDLILMRKRYFREFLAADEGIASNILAQRLKLLEACGVVERRRDPANARQVIYQPTATGLDLIPVLLELARFGATHDAHTAAPKAFVRRIAQEREDMVREIRSFFDPRTDA